MNSSVKVLFWLYKSKKNKHGLIPIYIRVTLNKTKMEIASGYFIPSLHWNDKKKQVIENISPQGAEINNALQFS
jgi:Arm domain-containing DNA-binding protein